MLSEAGRRAQRSFPRSRSIPTRPILPESIRSTHQPQSSHEKRKKLVMLSGAGRRAQRSFPRSRSIPTRPILPESIRSTHQPQSSHEKRKKLVMLSAVEASLPHQIPFRETTGQNLTTVTANPPRTSKYSTMRDPRYYCTYIMASHSGTLYIGVSGNLHRRVFQHKFHHFEGFTDRYNVVRLIYWESYDDVHKALAREKQLKGWTRAKKTP